MGELALLMVKKMWEMFCKKGKGGPRQHVTKDGSIMDNRGKFLAFLPDTTNFCLRRSARKPTGCGSASFPH